jgi:hypothetical protein
MINTPIINLSMEFLLLYSLISELIFLILVVNAI